LVSPSRPSLESILPELKTVLPNVCLWPGFGRQADFVIEGYVVPREHVRDEGSLNKCAEKPAIAHFLPPKIDP
jgi:hypothetical protein